jgi:hypothetical protein
LRALSDWISKPATLIQRPVNSESSARVASGSPGCKPKGIQRLDVRAYLGNCILELLPHDERLLPCAHNPSEIVGHIIEAADMIPSGQHGVEMYDCSTSKELLSLAITQVDLGKQLLVPLGFGRIVQADNRCGDCREQCSIGLPVCGGTTRSRRCASGWRVLRVPFSSCHVTEGFE